MPILLYGSETWTLYAHEVQQLRTVQQRHLRNIMRIKWDDFVSNEEVYTQKIKLCRCRSYSSQESTSLAWSRCPYGWSSNCQTDFLWWACHGKQTDRTPTLTLQRYYQSSPQDWWHPSIVEWVSFRSACLEVKCVICLWKIKWETWRSVWKRKKIRKK